MSTPQSFQPQGQQVPSVPPKAPFKQQQSHAYAIPLPATDHGFYEGMTNCLGNMMGFIGSIPVLGYVFSTKKEKNMCSYTRFAN